MADTFGRFDEHARRVLRLAQEEAHRFNHNYIGTEHFLLGLVREKDGAAAQVLTNMGIQLPKVRSAVEFIIGRGDRAPTGDIGLTPRAKKVIELAVDEARELNHHHIGTEHLLLGLVREGEGIAAGVLYSLGASLEKVRIETLVAIGAMERPSQPPSSDAQRLTSLMEASDGVLDEARSVLDHARQESRRRGDGAIGAEHFLLAMTEVECIAAQVLTSLEIDVKELRFALEFILDRRRKSESVDEAMQRRAGQVIDLADAQARQFSHRNLNSGHLLLGIIRVRSGLASGVLSGLGVDVESASTELRRIVGEGTTDIPPDLIWDMP